MTRRQRRRDRLFECDDANAIEGKCCGVRGGASGERSCFGDSRQNSGIDKGVVRQQPCSYVMPVAWSYDGSMNESEHRDERTGRWQRREQRRVSVRNRLQKHGAGLRTTYRDAILKRLRDKKRK